MKLHKIKRKIHLLAFDQLPFVMKILRIPPPREESGRNGLDPEVEVEFEPHEDEKNSNEQAHEEGYQELNEGDALGFEKELKLDEVEDDPEFVEQANTNQAKLSFKQQIKHKIEELKNKVNIEKAKNFKQDWASYSDEEKKEKKKKFFSIGVRALAVIVVLWVLLDDVIFSDKKPDNPEITDITQVNKNDEGLQESTNVDTKDIAIINDEQDLVDTDSPMNTETEDIIAGNDEGMDIDPTDPIDQMNANSDITDTDSVDLEAPTENTDSMETTPDTMAGDTSTMDNSTDSTDSMDTTEVTNDEPEDESDLEMTDFDKKGYEKVPGDNKINEVVFDEVGYKDITAEELEVEVENSMTEEEKEASPQDREIEGVSINVLRELENKLRQKELERDQELLGKKEDLSLRGKKVPAIDFYRAGRALVYNCQASHWACVDELSYMNCREADTINTQKKASSTCMPYDIYVSEKDCQRAQYEFMDIKDGEANCQN